MDDRADFIRRHTRVAAPALVPELRLHLATEYAPLWQATEDFLAEAGLPPPFWAFAWPGSQALARHLLDHPDLVAGRRVLDFAAGCGLAAIAAARAGAASVTASEIDAFAVAAIRLNAAENAVALEVRLGDVAAGLPEADVVLAGDVCYERTPAASITAWLRACAAAGRTVLLADPGRAYAPGDGLAELARYAVPTTRELEDRETRDTVLWRVDA